MSNFQKNLEILHEFGILEDEIKELKLRVAQAASGQSLIRKTPIVMTNNNATSQVEPRFIIVENVAELKRIGGIPDARYDEGWEHGITMPQPPTKATLATQNPYHPDVCAALRVFMYGDSRTVAAYEDLINELRFPMAVANFVAQDVIVTKDSPLVFRDDEGLGNPISVTFKKVTVYAGGQIIWEAPGKMTCDEMVFKASAGPDGMLTDATTAGLVSIGSKGGDGGHGGSSDDLGKAPNGGDSSSGKNSCDVTAGKGVDGGNASAGGDGGDGKPGGDSEEIFYDVDLLDGPIPIGSYGGSGGDGGNGGNGGKGGDGGDGGAGSKNCSRGDGGDGGNGGDAGKGGDGGDAGNGADIMITYKSGNPKFQIVPNPSSGGSAGDSGKPGGPGIGGAGKTNGTNGDEGAKADPAEAGEAGKPGQIFVNGKAID